MDCCGNWNPSPSGSYALDFYVDATVPDTQYYVEGIELDTDSASVYTWLGSCATKWLIAEDDGSTDAWPGGAGVEVLKVQVSKWNYQAANPSFEIIDYFEVYDQYDAHGDGDLDAFVTNGINR